MDSHPEDNKVQYINREMADHHANIESATLLAIFPKEIWMIIFDKVFPTEELLRLTHSSVFFDMLLETERTKFLFPKVIQILRHIPANLSVNLSKRGKIGKDLLNCRLVCRAWQIGVDTVMQFFNTSSKLIDVACGARFRVPEWPTEGHFWLQEQPVQFLQRFDEKYASANRNPFVGRSLYIYCSDQLITDRMSFTQQLLQILGSYGHHLWSFSLYQGFREPFHPSFLCEILRDSLHLMPNLKVLKLRYLRDHTSDELASLRLRLESCVYPELKGLTLLHLENLPTPVFDALQRRYSHVKTFSSYTYWRNNEIFMQSHNLRNFTQLVLSLRDINSLIQSNTSIALLPLKTLIICFDTLLVQVDWQSLFRFLECRWGATLTELKIDFSFPRDDKTTVLPPLNLPNLKVFAFSAFHLVQLDFLLPMRNSLERLVVRYCRIPDREELDVEHDGEVQFYRLRANLESSNIWSLFSILKIVEYYDSETRHEQICHRPMSLM